MPAVYEVKDAAGKVYQMDGDSPEHASQRVADLHRVTVVAWRHPRTTIVVGCQTTD